jgi:hypothetical protein
LRAKPYSIEELNGLLFTVHDMLRQPELGEAHRNDVANANPWLLPLVQTLNQKEAWGEITKHGEVKAGLEGTVGEARLKIAYPPRAISEGLCKNLPSSFEFALKDGTYTY